MRACLRWEQRTGRTFMGTSGRSFLLGCWSHWVKSAHTRCFVYANHAGNVVTWHLHTGIFVYVMNVPIIVGRSMFGLEFVATRITRDSIVALRYNIYHVAGILQVGKEDTVRDHFGGSTENMETHIADLLQFCTRVNFGKF